MMGNVRNSLARLGIFWALTPLVVVADIDALVNRAATELRGVLGNPADVVMIDGDASFTTVGGTIQISRTQLRGLLADVPARLLYPATALHLGHEGGHQHQFEQFDLHDTQTTARWGRVLETDADIWAGRSGFRALASEGLADWHAADELCEVAAKTFYAAGMERFALGSHPGRTTRSMAVGFGIFAGLYEEALRAGDVRRTLDGRTLEELRQRVPFQPSRIDVEWQLKLSKALVHFDSHAMRDLVISDKSVGWSGTMTDPRGSAPTVTARLRFRNQGDRVLHVACEIPLALIPRQPLDHTTPTLRIAAKSFEFTLKPGESVSKECVLRWDAAELKGNSQRYLPVVFLPPQDESLWFVEYADDPAIPIGPTRANPQRVVGTWRFSGDSVENWKDALLQVRRAFLDPEGNFAGPEDRSETGGEWPLAVAVPRGTAFYRTDTTDLIGTRIDLQVDCGGDAEFAAQTMADIEAALHAVDPDIAPGRQEADWKTWRNGRAEGGVRLARRTSRRMDPVVNREVTTYRVEVRFNGPTRGDRLERNERDTRARKNEIRDVDDFLFPKN